MAIVAGSLLLFCLPNVIFPIIYSPFITVIGLGYGREFIFAMGNGYCTNLKSWNLLIMKSFQRRSTPLITQYQMILIESMHANNFIWTNCFVVIFLGIYTHISMKQ